MTLTKLAIFHVSVRSRQSHPASLLAGSSQSTSGSGGECVCVCLDEGEEGTYQTTSAEEEMERWRDGCGCKWEEAFPNNICNERNICRGGPGVRGGRHRGRSDGGVFTELATGHGRRRRICKQRLSVCAAGSAHSHQPALRHIPPSPIWGKKKLIEAEPAGKHHPSRWGCVWGWGWGWGGVSAIGSIHLHQGHRCSS